jgi:hypothetical protein
LKISRPIYLDTIFEIPVQLFLFALLARYNLSVKPPSADCMVRAERADEQDSAGNHFHFFTYSFCNSGISL